MRLGDVDLEQGTVAHHTLDPTGDDIAWLLHHAGEYVLTRGEPASAQPMFERALRLRRSVLSEDHPRTLASASNLAADLRALGCDDEVTQLEEWVRSRS